MRVSSIAAVLAAVGATMITPRLAAQTSVSRKWEAGSWRLVGGVPPNDLLLLNPYLMDVADGIVVVADGGDMTIKAFSAEGKLLWTAGQVGAGPGEFRSPFDLHFDADKRVWIYDPANARMTILESDGSLRKTIPFTTRLTKFIPRTAGQVWALPARAHPFITEFDSLGQIAKKFPPPPERADRSLLEIESSLSKLPRGGAAVVSVQSDRFYLVDSSGSSVRHFRGIQPQASPKPVPVTVLGPGGRKSRGFRADPNAKYTALAATSDGKRLLLLYGEAAPQPRRTVDAYRLSDGAYLSSYLLPEEAGVIRMDNGLLVALVLDPAPAIRFWRWEPVTNPNSKKRTPTIP